MQTDEFIGSSARVTHMGVFQGLSGHLVQRGAGYPAS
jgi:hypothetical protein